MISFASETAPGSAGSTGSARATPRPVGRFARPSFRGPVRLATYVTIVAFLALGPFLNLGSASAQSYYDFNFTNNSGETIELAVLLREEANCGIEGWSFSGWWTLPPGETRTFMAASAVLYYHGRSADGGVWDGNDGVDTQIGKNASSGDFDWCQYETNGPWWYLYGGGIVDDSERDHYIKLRKLDASGYSGYNQSLS